MLGASFDRDDLDLRPRAGDNRAALRQISGYAPQLAAALAPTAAAEHVALRSATPDRLPLVGPLPDYPQNRLRYQRLANGRGPARYLPPVHQPGLYLLGGLGSRGITAAPLAAELLAAQLCGEPLPLPRGLADALNPMRLLIRALMRSG